jgi:hypothetical protein
MTSLGGNGTSEFVEHDEDESNARETSRSDSVVV